MSPTGLQARLDDLDRLCPDPVVAEWAERARTHRFRILIAGEAKRGKSSLVNALTGTDALPTGVAPLTALPIVVGYAERPALTVTYAAGRMESRPVGDLAVLATEGGNPDNRLGVARLWLGVPSPLLAGGVELVDTPGVGTVYDTSAAATMRALDTMDATILVLSADPPISASERALLESIRGRAMAVFCVLNKTDRLDAADLDEVIAYTRTVLAGVLGSTPPIYPTNARTGTGVGTLTEALTAYLERRREPDLAASIAGHARRLVERHLDEAVLTRRAATADTDRDRAELDAFTTRLDDAGRWRADAHDLARAEFARLLAALNAAAAADGPVLARDAAATVTRLMDAAPAGESTAAREDRVRAVAVEVITGLIDGWRQARQDELRIALRQLDARLTGDLNDQLDTVRTASQRLLGLRLELPPPDDEPIRVVRADYAFDPPIGVTVAWEAGIRRHLPGRLGRDRVRAYLIAEARDLTDRQIGRTRAGFQRALHDTEPRVRTAIDARYRVATAGLRAAIDAATGITAAPDRALRLAALDQRIDDLRRLHDDLDPLAVAAR